MQVGHSQPPRRQGRSAERVGVYPNAGSAARNPHHASGCIDDYQVGMDASGPWGMVVGSGLCRVRVRLGWLRALHQQFAR
jgi:hypothetical protein